MRLGELLNMWFPGRWHCRHWHCCVVRCGGLLIFLVLHWCSLLQWDHRQSLGHGHGRVGVGVEEFFVERREEYVYCFWVELLEGLELLGVERTQGWQCWDTADQLPDKRKRRTKKCILTMEKGKIRSCAFCILINFSNCSTSHEPEERLSLSGLFS